MHKPFIKIAVATLSVTLFGGLATYAAAQVSTEPPPQVVIPGTSVPDDHGGSSVVSDDPVGHDANDDHGGSSVVSQPVTSQPVTSQPTGNTVTSVTVDDHGGDRSGGGHGSDDGSGSGGGHGSDG